MEPVSAFLVIGGAKVVAAMTAAAPVVAPAAAATSTAATAALAATAVIGAGAVMTAAPASAATIAATAAPAAAAAIAAPATATLAIGTGAAATIATTAAPAAAATIAAPATATLAIGTGATVAATIATTAAPAAAATTAAPATATLAIGTGSALATEKAQELATQVLIAKLELGGKIVAGASAVATPIVAHACNKDAKTHEHELQQKALDRQSFRNWDERFLLDLAGGNCGNTGNPKYDEHMKELFVRNPAAQFSLETQVKKCIEEARLKQQLASRG